MEMDAKGFFARQETTTRKIRKQLEKVQTVRAKTAPKSTAHRCKAGDPVCVLRPRPLGTHCSKIW